ncbi:MAG: hypothetical protein ACRD04_06100 [Terriglobales bacterium]
MASLVPNVPLRFMLPSQKYALMNWLSKQLGLPGRISAQVLGQWGETLGVEISTTDYDLVRNHMIVTPAAGGEG